MGAHWMMSHVHMQNLYQRTPPALLLRVLLEKLLEPHGLGLGDVHLMAREARGAEVRRAKTHAERLLADMVAEVGRPARLCVYTFD